jgi:hypothetical protein
MNFPWEIKWKGESVFIRTVAEFDQPLDVKVWKSSLGQNKKTRGKTSSIVVTFPL